MRFKKLNSILRVNGASLKLNTTPIANNTISAAQTICYNTAPTALAGSTPTGSGVYRYLWLVSSNDSIYTTASGVNNAKNYSPAALTANRWYKRTVTTAYSTDTSASVKITVATVFAAGTIAGGGAGKAPYTPSIFQSVAPASGGVGSISYLWQRQYNGGAWSNAPGGSTSATYQATGLTPAGTYKFRRRATNTCGTLYSNELTVVVTP